MSRGSLESLVAGQQRSFKRLGQGHVNRVVYRQIVAQLPGARQEEIVWIASHRQVCKIVQRCPAALLWRGAFLPLSRTVQLGVRFPEASGALALAAKISLKLGRIVEVEGG